MLLKWDQNGKKLYETGVDRGVLFPIKSDGTYDNGVAWNGLTAVNESPEGAEPTPLYANNAKYLNLMSAEDFKGTIEAFTHPEEFYACNGYDDSAANGVYLTQQTRKGFGLAYRTLIGNDTEGTNHGYKIHLVYGAIASPSERENTTINEDPEAATLSWEFSTTPVAVSDVKIGETTYKFKPLAHIVIDSTVVNATQLAAFEEILYGKEGTGTDGATGAVQAKLPLPDEVIATFKAA